MRSRCERPVFQSLSDVAYEREHDHRFEDLDDALEQLSRADRRLLQRRYYEGASCAAIADALGTTPGAIRVRLYRARQRLSAFLR
jgi:RNA polymerase sigma-70 factor (ECF subfamily)